MGERQSGRREFLKGALVLGGASVLNAYLAFPALSGTVDLARARGPNPYSNTHKAIQALGGMERFVKKGMRVCILANLAWARTPSQAANVEPKVIRCIADLCEKSGAGAIDVFCNPCNDARISYEKSGIQSALIGSKARLQFINSRGFVQVSAKKGVKVMSGGANVYRIAREADVLINVPVLKHHSLAGLTMCMKNLMGAIKNRSVLHPRIHDALPDLVMMIPSHLCVLDATRILRRNGPSGGNLKDVEVKDTLIAGISPVKVDALGADLFGTNPGKVGYLAEAHRRGLGEINTARLAVADVRG